MYEPMTEAPDVLVPAFAENGLTLERLGCVASLASYAATNRANCVMTIAEPASRFSAVGQSRVKTTL